MNTLVQVPSKLYVKKMKQFLIHNIKCELLHVLLLLLLLLLLRTANDCIYLHFNSLLQSQSHPPPQNPCLEPGPPTVDSCT